MVIVVAEWDCDSFHRGALELEEKGYAARREPTVLRRR